MNHRSAALARVLQIGIILVAGVASAAVIYLLVHSLTTTDSGQANIGAGLAAMAALPSIVAFALSAANLRTVKTRSHVALMLIVAILLTPSACLLALVYL